MFAYAPLHNAHATFVGCLGLLPFSNNFCRFRRLTFRFCFLSAGTGVEVDISTFSNRV